MPINSKPAKTIKIDWGPQPRQLICLDACGLSHPWLGGPPRAPLARVIGYGGAAGGGKSDALLGIALVAGITYPGISIGYFRREYPQLEGPGGAIVRAHEIFTGFAQYNGGMRRWTMPGGSILQFCHCKDEADVYSYQSQQFDIILIDEATQFSRAQYRYLLTRNRATKDGVIPFMVLGTNPGGVGHVWFLTEFVDIGPPEEIREVTVEPGVRERHFFIPARLSDNQILETRDPSYRVTLESQPEITRRQLLDGDWSAFSGQYFRSWRRDVHVIRPYPLPAHHKKFRMLDYGLDCTACYWGDIADNGRVTLYRELYQPDLILSRAARRIVELTPPDEQIAYTVASPDLWNRRQDIGKSGVEILADNSLTGLRRADDSRVDGWHVMSEFLEPFIDEYGETSAFLQVFDTCENLIRTLPAAIRDPNQPDDVDDRCEDHGLEAVRYGLVSRPRPIKIVVDPLDAIRKIHPEWSIEFKMAREELAREDEGHTIGIEDLM